MPPASLAVPIRARVNLPPSVLSGSAGIDVGVNESDRKLDRQSMFRAIIGMIQQQIPDAHACGDAENKQNISDFASSSFENSTRYCVQENVYI
jgi:hypothetical protein